MSDQPTDLVFDALSRMKANRVAARASREALARLQSTTGGAPPGEAAPASRSPRPTERDLNPLSEPPRQKMAGKSIARTISGGGPGGLVDGVSAPTSATSHSSKAIRLEALRGPALACTQCAHLVKSRKQVVFGVGNPDAELMFVGEAPGADEDLVGEPFVGRAGQLLTKIIETMGFRRVDIYIANILKCRPEMPPGAPGNRKPTPDEMKVCKPWLLQQIDIIQPKVIVALGATAVEGLLDIERAGITKMRGTWKEFRGTPVMPTFHPSFLLRPTGDQLANKRLVWEDMLAVLTHLGRTITPKQQAYFLPK